jgi:hypothetical protein
MRNFLCYKYTGNSPTTVQPTTTNPVTTDVSTTSQTSRNAKYGGTLKYITNQIPGTPIGWNAEAIGASVLSRQISLQFLLKEQLIHPVF